MLMAAVLDNAGVVGVKMQPTVAAIGYLAALSLVLVALSFLFSRFTEVHTPDVRNFLIRKLSRRTAVGY